MNLKTIEKRTLIIISSIIFILFLTLSGKLFEDVKADEIVINQVPVTGTLEFWTIPGLKFQMFGDI